ncbi:alpha/beta fold hydrolase [Cupriavidus sp. CP313]
MPPEVRHHYPVLNGFRLHYAACGDPDQPLLLFVHGFPESWLAWREQLQAFGEHYYAVALDTRGINESEGPTELRGYRAGNMVADLAALLDHLGRDRCVLVGHDWGGSIACAFAIAHPRRLHGLVMINAVHPAVFLRELLHNPAQQAASGYMDALTAEEGEQAVCADDFAYLSAMLAQGGHLPAWFEATRHEYRRAWSQPGSVRAGLSYYAASPLHPGALRKGGPGAAGFDDEAVMLRMPTLVIWGERDRFLLPGCLEGLSRYVRDLRVERIADASHWVVHEQGPKVNRLITEFLNERIDVA